MSWKVEELQMSSQKRSHLILRSACCQSLPDQPVACCHAQCVLQTESATGCSRISSFSTSIISSTTSSFSDIFCLSWPWAFRTLLYWQIKSVPTKMSSLFLLFKSSTWTFSPFFSVMSLSRAWLSLSLSFVAVFVPSWRHKPADEIEQMRNFFRSSWFVTDPDYVVLYEYLWQPVKISTSFKFTLCLSFAYYSK